MKLVSLYFSPQLIKIPIIASALYQADKLLVNYNMARKVGRGDMKSVTFISQIV